jgi:hypothetical protein
MDFDVGKENKSDTQEMFILLPYRKAAHDFFLDIPVLEVL